MDILLYGMGQQLIKQFTDADYYFQCMKDDSVDIAGILDGDSEKVGKEIIINQKKYIVQGKETWEQYDFKYIVITSNKYYDEIRIELIQSGVQEDKIISLTCFLYTYTDRVFHTKFYQNQTGIEIGGPSTIFSNIYSVCEKCDGVNFSDKTVWWEGQNVYKYQGKELGRVCICEATDMSIIPDCSYGFLLSSNNLEHIANPLKALKEFQRIVECGGYILVAVPNKEHTFDHNREFTAFEHILSDFENDVQEDDLTHLPEIIEKHDYNMDPQCGGKENFIKRAEDNISNRCLHHHVFNEDCLRKMFDYIGMKVVEFAAIRRNYIILGKN